jgi:hypothetical protein
VHAPTVDRECALVAGDIASRTTSAIALLYSAVSLM